MEEFITVAVMHIFAVVSPGPDFALITRQCFRYGRIVALWSSLGIAMGIVFHVFLSLTGLSILIQHQPLIFNVIKILGSLYIAFLGLVSILSTSRLRELGEDSSQEVKKLKSFATGLMTNTLNPKAFIFFITVFSLVISENTPIMFKIFMGAYMSMATFVWFSFLSVMLTNNRANGIVYKYFPWLEKITGFLLIFISLRILFGEVEVFF